MTDRQFKKLTRAARIGLSPTLGERAKLDFHIKKLLLRPRTAVPSPEIFAPKASRARKKPLL